MATHQLLREFEGFRETPYWDVNAYRVGYGSDTITTPDGRAVRVTPETRVTRADAERDLDRRVSTEFEPIARRAAGSAWETLRPEQRSALTSIAYNYGRIPDIVAQALQTGGDVSLAIRSLGGHNEGINRSRREREADAFAAGNIVDPAQPKAPTFEEYIEQRNALGQQLQQADPRAFMQPVNVLARNPVEWRSRLGRLG